MASAQDIFDGQCSLCREPKTGKFKSIANRELFFTETFDSAERFLATVAQDEGTKRFVLGIQ